MAKCVLDNQGRPKRVSDDEAAAIVKAGGKYLSKGEYNRALDGKLATAPAGK